TRSELATAAASAGLSCTRRSLVNSMISVRTIHLPYSAIDATRNHAIRTGPAAVMVWSQTTDTGDPAQVSAVLETAGRPAVLVAAGPGWPDDLPGAGGPPTTSSRRAGRGRAGRIRRLRKTLRRAR